MAAPVCSCGRFQSQPVSQVGSVWFGLVQSEEDNGRSRDYYNFIMPLVRRRCLILSPLLPLLYLSLPLRARFPAQFGLKQPPDELSEVLTLFTIA